MKKMEFESTQEYEEWRKLIAESWGAEVGELPSEVYLATEQTLSGFLVLSNVRLARMKRVLWTEVKGIFKFKGKKDEE